MKISTQIKEAFSNICSVKLRSILAVLGILVGTASVVAMVSGGELATRQALLQFKELGTDLLAVSINSTTHNASPDEIKSKVSLETALNSRKASPEITLVAPYTNLFTNITYNGNKINGNIIGSTENLPYIMKLKMQSGRFVSYFDQYAFLCVLGNKIYKQIKKYVSDPIGKQIKLGGNFFTIVGVAQPWEENSFVYADLNNTIFIPIQTSTILSKYTEINQIIMRLQPNADIETTKTQITNYFKTNTTNKQLYFRSAKQFIEKMEKQKQIMTIFLGFIGSIALIVGGIGVMNIMLVSVTERRREIGIRLAVGARRRDIQSLFLVESIILSLFGGITGVLLGILISFVIAKARGWGFTLFFTPLIVGFSVSVFTGIFFGFYPAYKASKLDPIETLRSE
jgi:putative ABC transport system permease protein